MMTVIMGVLFVCIDTIFTGRTKRRLPRVDWICGITLCIGFGLCLDIILYKTTVQRTTAAPKPVQERTIR